MISRRPVQRAALLLAVLLVSPQITIVALSSTANPTQAPLASTTEPHAGSTDPDCNVRSCGATTSTGESVVDKAISLWQSWFHGEHYIRHTSPVLKKEMTWYLVKSSNPRTRDLEEEVKLVTRQGSSHTRVEGTLTLENTLTFTLTQGKHDELRASPVASTMMLASPSIQPLEDLLSTVISNANVTLSHSSTLMTFTSAAGQLQFIADEAFVLFPIRYIDTELKRDDELIIKQRQPRVIARAVRTGTYAVTLEGNVKVVTFEVTVHNDGSVTVTDPVSARGVSDITVDDESVELLLNIVRSFSSTTLVSLGTSIELTVTSDTLRKSVVLQSDNAQYFPASWILQQKRPTSGSLEKPATLPAYLQTTPKLRGLVDVVLRVTNIMRFTLTPERGPGSTTYAVSPITSTRMMPTPEGQALETRLHQFFKTSVTMTLDENALRFTSPTNDVLLFDRVPIFTYTVAPPVTSPPTQSPVTTTHGTTEPVVVDPITTTTTASAATLAPTTRSAVTATLLNDPTSDSLTGDWVVDQRSTALPRTQKTYKNITVKILDDLHGNAWLQAHILNTFFIVLAKTKDTIVPSTVSRSLMSGPADLLAFEDAFVKVLEQAKGFTLAGLTLTLDIGTTPPTQLVLTRRSLEPLTTMLRRRLHAPQALADAVFTMSQQDIVRLGGDAKEEVIASAVVGEDSKVLINFKTREPLYAVFHQQPDSRAELVAVMITSESVKETQLTPLETHLLMELASVQSIIIQDDAITLKLKSSPDLVLKKTTKRRLYGNTDTMLDWKRDTAAAVSYPTTVHPQPPPRDSTAQAWAIVPPIDATIVSEHTTNPAIDAGVVWSYPDKLNEVPTGVPVAPTVMTTAATIVPTVVTHPATLHATAAVPPHFGAATVPPRTPDVVPTPPVPVTATPLYPARTVAPPPTTIVTAPPTTVVTRPPATIITTLPPTLPPTTTVMTLPPTTTTTTLPPTTTVTTLPPNTITTSTPFKECPHSFFSVVPDSFKLGGQPSQLFDGQQFPVTFELTPTSASTYAGIIASETPMIRFDVTLDPQNNPHVSKVSIEPVSPYKLTVQAHLTGIILNLRQLVMLEGYTTLISAQKNSISFSQTRFLTIRIGTVTPGQQPGSFFGIVPPHLPPLTVPAIFQRLAPSDATHVNYLFSFHLYNHYDLVLRQHIVTGETQVLDFRGTRFGGIYRDDELKDMFGLTFNTQINTKIQHRLRVESALVRHLQATRAAWFAADSCSLILQATTGEILPFDFTDNYPTNPWITQAGGHPWHHIQPATVVLSEVVTRSDKDALALSGVFHIYNTYSYDVKRLGRYMLITNVRALTDVSLSPEQRSLEQRFITRFRTTQAILATPDASRLEFHSLLWTVAFVQPTDAVALHGLTYDGSPKEQENTWILESARLNDQQVALQTPFVIEVIDTEDKKSFDSVTELLVKGTNKYEASVLDMGPPTLAADGNAVYQSITIGPVVVVTSGSNQELGVEEALVDLLRRATFITGLDDMTKISFSAGHDYALFRKTAS